MNDFGGINQPEGWRALFARLSDETGAADGLDRPALCQEMNRAEYIKHLNEIRTRVRLDLDPAAEDFPANSARAQKHLQVVAAYKPLVPQIHRILPTLTMTLESFYEGTCNRGWAQHYIQQDLKRLEELWPEDSE